VAQSTHLKDIICVNVISGILESACSQHPCLLRMWLMGSLLQTLVQFQSKNLRN